MNRRTKGRLPCRSMKIFDRQSISFSNVPDTWTLTINETRSESKRMVPEKKKKKKCGRRVRWKYRLGIFLSSFSDLFGYFGALLFWPIVNATICGNNRQFEILIEPFVRFVSLFVDFLSPYLSIRWEYRKKYNKYNSPVCPINHRNRYCTAPFSISMPQVLFIFNNIDTFADALCCGLFVNFLCVFFFHFRIISSWKGCGFVSFVASVYIQYITNRKLV